MPSFLSLPLEIRESIIEQVLCDRQTPPSYPSKSDRIDFHDIDYKAWRSSTKIYHEQRSTHCPSNCLPLLLTSRQIHGETQSVLDRGKSKNLPYILDVSVLNEYDLFPTWVSVPSLTNRVHELHTDIRLFGSIIPSEIAARLVGSGGRLGFHWSFYALLERFLRYGPVDQKKENRHPDINEKKEPASFSSNPNFEDRDITIKTLTLDCQSAESVLPSPPEHIEYDTWQGQHSLPTWLDGDNYPRERLEQYRSRPEWLADYLLCEIDGLLKMSYNTASYGKILYERVGTLWIVSPGGKTEVNLAGRLASLRFTSPRDTFGEMLPDERLATFWEWKKETLARREKLGFPVVWPQDPELEGLS